MAAPAVERWLGTVATIRAPHRIGHDERKKPLSPVSFASFRLAAAISSCTICFRFATCVQGSQRFWKRDGLFGK
jgi:hypothetical protein